MEKTEKEIPQIEDCSEEESKKKCPICGRPTKITNYGSNIEVMTKHEKISLVQDCFFCRYCHEGFSLLDTELQLFGITK